MELACAVQLDGELESCAESVLRLPSRAPLWPSSKSHATLATTWMPLRGHAGRRRGASHQQRHVRGLLAAVLEAVRRACLTGTRDELLLQGRIPACQESEWSRPADMRCNDETRGVAVAQIARP